MKLSRNLFLGFTTIFGVQATFPPLVKIDPRSLDEIYASAKKENATLQVFWGGDAGAAGDQVRIPWKKRFPDVPLNLTVDLSKYLDVEIDRAWQEQKHVADVAALQTIHNFPRWKFEGKLLPFKPSNLDDILNGEKDFDGAYLPRGLFGFGNFLYDTTKIHASSVPRSFASMADPEWKGKLILTYPNDDDSIVYLFSLIILRYGWQWSYDPANNNVQWVRGTFTPAYELMTQHNSTSKRYLSFTAYNIGIPFLVTKEIDPPEERMSWVHLAGILASTKVPESAKLLMAWLLSDEFQGQPNGYGYATSLNSVNQEMGLSPYCRNVTQVAGFREFMQKRERVEWWMRSFESVIGTPQGKGPLETFPNPK